MNSTAHPSHALSQPKVDALAGKPLRVLMLTKDWPTADRPGQAPFVRRQSEALAAAGVQVEVFVFEGRRNLLNYLWAWVAVRRKLGRLRRDGQLPDVIHAQFGQAAAAVWPTRLPLVVTLRGSDIEGIVGSGGRYTLPGRILKAWSRFIAGRADEVIVVSESLARSLPAGRRYSVVPSGLDLERFRPLAKDACRRELGLHPSRRLVLFGGDPSNHRKRYDLARAALARVPAALDAELVVARHVPHARVPLYMNACDVLLLTSLHEGSPNVVKEALACDTPVVAVNVGDVTERLRGLSGAVVCADDRPETIAQALCEVLGETRPFLGRHSVEQLDERILTRKVIGIYRDAIRGAGRAGGEPPTRA